MIESAEHWLFVCSANYIRSPTAEFVARRRLLLASSCGTTQLVNGREKMDTGFCVMPLSEWHVEWAHIIVCMEREHVDVVRSYPLAAEREVWCWNLPDDWRKPYDPHLMRIIEQKLTDTMEERKRAGHHQS